MASSAETDRKERGSRFICCRPARGNLVLRSDFVEAIQHFAARPQYHNTEREDQEGTQLPTTTPNAVTSPVHDRMPVILDRDSYDKWLDPGMTNVEAVSEMLKPFDPLAMRCYPVGARVNHVANDDEGCSTPVELAQIQNRLF